MLHGFAWLLLIPGYLLLATFVFLAVVQIAAGNAALVFSLSSGIFDVRPLILALIALLLGLGHAALWGSRKR